MGWFYQEGYVNSTNLLDRMLVHNFFLYRSILFDCSVRGKLICFNDFVNHVKNLFRSTVLQYFPLVEFIYKDFMSKFILLSIIKIKLNFSILLSYIYKFVNEQNFNNNFKVHIHYLNKQKQTFSKLPNRHKNNQKTKKPPTEKQIINVTFIFHK